MLKVLGGKFRTNHVDHGFLLRIYKGFVRPLFEYNHIPLLSVSGSIQQRLQVFQNKCIRVCLRVPIWTRISTLHNLSVMPFLSCRLRTLSSKYFNRALGCNVLIRDEYILYDNDRAVRDGHNMEGRRPYPTPMAVLSGLGSLV